MAVNDGYLRSVPADANLNDGRLYDPTQADVGGAATITCVGIASAEAFGSPSVQPAVAFAGIASAEAIGSPTLGAQISTTGIATAEALGSPALAAEVAPAGIASTEAIGAPTLAAVLALAGISTAEAFGLPTVTTDAAPPTSATLGGGRARFSWADYMSLISEDQPVASTDDEDAIVLAACMLAVLETS